MFPLVVHRSSFEGWQWGVIPGEHRETRNPGGSTTGTCFIFLDASFRRHDEITPPRIIAADYWSNRRVESSQGSRHHAVFGLLQKGHDLLAADGRKPFEKIIYGLAAFEIIQQG